MNDRPYLRRGGVWAFVSGGLLALAYPSADLGVLGFVALVPFLLSLQDIPQRAAARRGYACGAAFFVVLLYWIPRVMTTYGGLPLVVAWLLFFLLVAYLASYFALFALLVAASWRRLGGVSLALAPFAWVALELARGQLLSGFPWGLLGYSQYRNLELLQSAAWGGIYLVSFFVAASNAGIALLFSRPGKRHGLAVGGLLMLVALAHAGGLLALRAADPGSAGEDVPVAAIQANVPQERKWSPGDAAQILSDLVSLTREAAGARLIVWPESSSPFSLRRPAQAPGGGRPVVEMDETYLAVLADLARTLEADLIVGSVDYSAEGGLLRALNSAVVVGPDGSPRASYDKIHLVPFGEYVPLHRLLFFVDRLAQGSIADFSAGERAQPLPTSGGPVATFICYEAIFPELVRRIARKDTVFLVNITNDAWFGTTAAPAQHLAMAAVRAAENRRYMVRAANTGISAIIDPFGRIVSRTSLMTRAVLRGSVRPRAGLTPYGACGDLFAWGCAILALLQCAALRAAFPRRG